MKGRGTVQGWKGMGAVASEACGSTTLSSQVGSELRREESVLEV